MTANHAPTPRRPGPHFDILEDLSALSLSSGSSGSSQSNPPLLAKRLDAPPKFPIVLPLTPAKHLNQQGLPRVVKLNTQPYPEHGSKYAQKVADDKDLYPESSTAMPDVDVLTKSTSQSSKATSLADSGGIVCVPSTGFVGIQNVQEEEINRLKAQLEAATIELARRDEEMIQHKITQHSIDQVLSSPSEANFPSDVGVGTFNSGRDNSMFPRPPSAVSPPPFEPFQGPWGSGFGGNSINAPPPVQGWNSSVPSSWPHQDAREGSSYQCRNNFGPIQRPSNLRVDTAYENDQPFFPGYRNPSFESGFGRTSMPNSRPGSSMVPFYTGGEYYSTGHSPDMSPAITPAPMPPFRASQHYQAPYQPKPIGTPLSAAAMEFQGGPLGQDNYSNASPWNATAPSEAVSTYMPSMEPMNYRRLLDRNMSCDWKYIVDKIVCSNDQQASIFLQQKLKVASSDQKRELVDAIIAQALPLMTNRFGNFLVQRCLEHGTSDQIIAIANAIRGNTLLLSMDPFGCHVVQKAFDVVPEDFKAIMVHELLRRIPETVIHRYACHVWQKLFELRWSDSPPQIMKYVNEALRGMWHEVALGETGSLVVQNIFENCLEEDKRLCINEILAKLGTVAQGQFGNWCIQHICEHGAPADKSRAIEHVLEFATEYSTDQFASKVVEKCLKVSGPDFMDRYLDRVCQARPDRPRMPLIDISGDQYGNYLVQYILTNASTHHKEVVAHHVRRHMVSLRGSKFGSRVAMLCCNPASSTRPGPPSTMPMNNRFAPIGQPGGGYSRMPSGPYR